mmetsp:Transcript_38699/g.67994  ORF Transcript_38699/g.67994 Transcript_38699/m.67994 type:complete len:219 (+) Transcript_38699:1170-1826(+)
MDAKGKAERGEGAAKVEHAIRVEPLVCGWLRWLVGQRLDEDNDEQHHIDRDVEVRERRHLREGLEEDVEPHDRSDDEYRLQLREFDAVIGEDLNDVLARKHVIDGADEDEGHVHLHCDEPRTRRAEGGVADVRVPQRRRSVGGRLVGSRVDQRGAEGRWRGLCAHVREALDDDRRGVARHRGHEAEEQHAHPSALLHARRQNQKTGANNSAQDVEGGA